MQAHHMHKRPLTRGTTPRSARPTQAKAINGYVFNGVLGKGQYGTVYKAMTSSSHEVCAVKVISKSKVIDSNHEQSLQREIDVLAFLNHPNVARLLDFFEDSDNYYLVMDLCPGGELQEYIMKRLSKLLVKVRNIPVNNQPIFQSQTGICQMISVKCDPEEIANLNVRNFTMFFLGKDQGWDRPLVQKYTFVAASPLPACVSLVKVASHTVTDITKTDYFETKLKRFRDNYIKVVNNIEAVLPPPHMVKAWSNSVIGLSATPILRQMSKIFKTEKPEEHPYYILARRLIVGEKETDVPDRIRNVIHEIRNLLVGSMHVISAASKVSSLLPPEAADLQEFRKSLGLPCQ